MTDYNINNLLCYIYILGTLMRMSEVLSAYAIGAIFLEEYPDLYTILGAALIVGMTTALGIHRWQIVTARKAAAIQRRQSRERIRSHSSSGTEQNNHHQQHVR